MLSTRIRPTVAVFASAALLGLGACGDSDEPTADAPAGESAAASTPAASTPSTDAAATTPADSGSAAASSGDTPEWAQAATEGGDKISTIKVGDITVDVFQIGVAKATKSGQFVDPDTNKPVIAKGDDVVFVNYVITNDGDPVDLGSSRVNVSARYEDWKYLQGMDSVVDDDLFEEQGVNDDSLAPGGFKDPGVYTFGKGQRYSVGENFKYQKDSKINFEASVTPVDAEGELLHDDKTEGKSTGTIS